MEFEAYEEASAETQDSNGENDTPSAPEDS